MQIVVNNFAKQSTRKKQSYKHQQRQGKKTYNNDVWKRFSSPEANVQLCDTRLHGRATTENALAFKSAYN